MLDIKRRTKEGSTALPQPLRLEAIPDYAGKSTGFLPASLQGVATGTAYIRCRIKA